MITRSCSRNQGFRVVIERVFDYRVVMYTPVAPHTALVALSGRRTRYRRATGCAQLLTGTRQLRGWLDAVEAHITSRITELHDTAGGAPAADLHTRCGGVSAAEGKRKQRRSETIETATSFGEALGSGTIGAEHVDALANATTKLDDDTTTQLFDLEAGLLADAAAMTPEQFGRSCRDRIRRLERDQGLERNRRQRRRHIPVTQDQHRNRDDRRPLRLPPRTRQPDLRGPRLTKSLPTSRRANNPVTPSSSNAATTATGSPPEALGQLVTGGHQQQRPLEADITVIVDHKTAITGQLHPAPGRTPTRTRSATPHPLLPAGARVVL